MRLPSAVACWCVVVLPPASRAQGEDTIAAGGRFVPRLFGWIVHVNAFADDSAAVWGGHEMHEHTR